MVPFIWFPLSRVCHLHERAPERAWVRSSNLSLSRETFSYTYCKGLQVFPLVHGSFHAISTQPGASFAGARNHSFSKKSIFKFQEVVFLHFFGRRDASYARARMSAQPTIPCQNETPFRNNIYICHLHVASASAQPTMIVCPIHVLTFVTDCWWLECVFYYGIL